MFSLFVSELQAADALIGHLLWECTFPWFSGESQTDDGVMLPQAGSGPNPTMDEVAVVWNVLREADVDFDCVNERKHEQKNFAEDKDMRINALIYCESVSSHDHSQWIAMRVMNIYLDQTDWCVAENKKFL